MNQQAIFSGFNPDINLKKATAQQIDELMDWAPMDSDCFFHLNRDHSPSSFTGRIFLKTIWGKIFFAAEGNKAENVIQKLCQGARELLTAKRKDSLH